MSIAHSPLRYPGGKASISYFLADIIKANGFGDWTYVEPFAGGAGAALSLLFSENSRKIILNDLDPCVYAIWYAILTRKNDFINRIKETPVTLEEWYRQRDIYRNQSNHSRIKVAFASLFMNRCNRSGIMANGGPIGGHDQMGKWKIDARFNKDELIKRINRIYLYRDRIEIYNMDAIEFLKKIICRNKEKELFVYLDPPYYLKGNQLYLNHYQHKDHLHLSEYISKFSSLKWILTYDDVPEIRAMYRNCHIIPFEIGYSAHRYKTGKELLIHRPEITVPYEL